MRLIIPLFTNIQIRLQKLQSHEKWISIVIAVTGM